jgi:hypothetical protein
MTVLQAFSFGLTLLALVLTLSTLLLLFFWHHWQTREGRAILELLGSIALWQLGTILLHISLLADLADPVVEACLRVLLIGFALTGLTTLAALLHVANMVKEGWELVLRIGIAVLIVAQPGLWQDGFLKLPAQLDHDLLGQPFTNLGRVMALICGGYLLLTWVAGRRYWRRVDTPLLTRPLVGLAGFQLLALISGPLREFSLAAIVGGVVSTLIGLQMVRELRQNPMTHRATWLQTWHNTAQMVVSAENLNARLARIAQETRSLLRADLVIVLLVTGRDRLKV